MRNCLQLCSGDYDFVGEFEKNRVALISAQGIRKKNIDDRESLLTARALMRSERRVEGVSDNWVDEIGGPEMILIVSRSRQLQVHGWTERRNEIQKAKKAPFHIFLPACVATRWTGHDPVLGHSPANISENKFPPTQS